MVNYIQSWHRFYIKGLCFIDVFLIKITWQIGVPVSWVIEQHVEMVSKLACWTVYVVTANLLTWSSAKRWDLCHFLFWKPFLIFLKETQRSWNQCCVIAGSGEEVADEHFLCGGMPCQLPTIWLVTMVWVHSHLWAGRYVCSTVDMSCESFT